MLLLLVSYFLGTWSEGTNSPYGREYLRALHKQNILEVWKSGISNDGWLIKRYSLISLPSERILDITNDAGVQIF